MQRYVVLGWKVVRPRVKPGVTCEEPSPSLRPRSGSVDRTVALGPHALRPSTKARDRSGSVDRTVTLGPHHPSTLFVSAQRMLRECGQDGRVGSTPPFDSLRLRSENAQGVWTGRSRWVHTTLRLSSSPLRECSGSVDRTVALGPHALRPSSPTTKARDRSERVGLQEEAPLRVALRGFFQGSVCLSAPRARAGYAPCPGSRCGRTRCRCSGHGRAGTKAHRCQRYQAVAPGGRWHPAPARTRERRA